MQSEWTALIGTELALYNLQNELHWHNEGAAVKGPRAMGPSLQLSTCVLFWGFLDFSF